MKRTSPNWIVSGLLAILAMTLGWHIAAQAGEVQTIAAEVSGYLWEIMAFFGVLGVLRVVQGVKKLRGLPLCLCNEKQGRNGTYRKLKKPYLIGVATLGSFAVITACLMQKYDNLNQVMLVAGICAVSQFTIIELLFKYLDTKRPGVAAVLSNGLYVPEDDQTVMTRVVQAAVGGGVDRRGPND